MNREEIEKNSRQVFGSHHAAEQANEDIFQRKLQYYTQDPYEYLEIPRGWFEGKKALDAGSGTALPTTQILLEAGATVTSLDLPGEYPFDDSRIRDRFKGKYNLMRGNVLELPFEDHSFDYVHCQGVLHHTVDAKKGFKELTRVCKPGGHVYITVFGTSGLFREVEDFFRAKYKKDEKFKSWVDNLTGEELKGYIRWTNQNMEENFPPIPEDLLDEDMAVTIKDRMQAPLYERYSQEEVFSWFTENGLNPKRVSRYAHGYKNLRRYFCPQYKNYNHPIAKLFNGEGLIQVIGKKNCS